MVEGLSALAELGAVDSLLTGQRQQGASAPRSMLPMLCHLTVKACYPAQPAMLNS